MNCYIYYLIVQCCIYSSDKVLVELVWGLSSDCAKFAHFQKTRFWARIFCFLFFFAKSFWSASSYCAHFCTYSNDTVLVRLVLCVYQLFTIRLFLCTRLMRNILLGKSVCNYQSALFCLIIWAHVQTTRFLWGLYLCENQHISVW